MSATCTSLKPFNAIDARTTNMTTSHEFYCRYGKHFVDKSLKIHTARQGDYICSDCEEKRTKDWKKSTLFTRRKNDRRDYYYSEED
jgi:predicted SprT family Zn-dependent metalloprotease